MSEFAGAPTPQQDGSEQDRVFLSHLCPSYVSGVATEAVSVGDAALLSVKRFQAGDITPTSFLEFMAGTYTVAK